MVHNHVDGFAICGPPGEFDKAFIRYCHFSKGVIGDLDYALQRQAGPRINHDGKAWRLELDSEVLLGMLRQCDRDKFISPPWHMTLFYQPMVLQADLFEHHWITQICCYLQQLMFKRSFDFQKLTKQFELFE
jgi:hypothetical protein